MKILKEELNGAVPKGFQKDASKHFSLNWFVMTDRRKNCNEKERKLVSLPYKKGAGKSLLENTVGWKSPKSLILQNLRAERATFTFNTHFEFSRSKWDFFVGFLNNEKETFWEEVFLPSLLFVDPEWTLKMDGNDVCCRSLHAIKKRKLLSVFALLW